MNWVNREQTNNKILPKTPNIGLKRNLTNNKSKTNNKENSLNPILKPLISNNETKPFCIDKPEKQGEENIYNILNNKTTTMFDRYYANKLKEKNMQNINNNNQYYTTENINNINNINNNINQNNINNQINSVDNHIQNADMNQTNTNNYTRNEAVEKLIKDYKEKYGSDEALENMINEYYGKTGFNIGQDNLNNDNNNIIPKIQNNNNNLKVVLPKIQKNYIRENRKLVIDNKVPVKHRQVEEQLMKNNKHKDYGKVPSYIKKYELEREIKRN